MGALGRYFKTQCQPCMFKLGHDNSTDFCLCCFQKSKTSLPLLCIRLVLFLGSVAIFIASLIYMGRSFNGYGFYFIYMTHWGLMAIVVTTGFATAVSWRAHFKGPIDATLNLPWYVKTFWACYDTTLPLAFFITIYYFGILLPMISEEWNLNPVIDFFIHGMNSIIMFILMVTSRVPSRLLHFYFVVAIGVVYLAFTAVYYAAGGADPTGNPWVYPTLDWSELGPTFIMIALSLVSLLVIHLVVVALAALRDKLTGNAKENLYSMN